MLAGWRVWRRAGSASTAWIGTGAALRAQAAGGAQARALGAPAEVEVSAHCPARGAVRLARQLSLFCGRLRLAGSGASARGHRPAHCPQPASRRTPSMAETDLSYALSDTMVGRHEQVRGLGGVALWARWGRGTAPDALIGTHRLQGLKLCPGDREQAQRGASRRSKNAA